MKLTWKRPDLIHLCSVKKLFLAILVTVCITCVVIQYKADELNDISPPPGDNRRYLTVVCQDGRGLGNVLFDYASLIGIAKTNNMTAVMPNNFDLAKVFHLKVHQVPNLERTLGTYENFEEFGRRSSAYDIGTASLPQHKSIKLLGYFQSWKYFQTAEAELRRHLKFRSQFLDTANSFLQEKTPLAWKGTNFTRVGIHVRRGDILLEHFKNFGYTSPGPDYFKKAMDYYKTKYSASNIQFVVCSDDIEWCKLNIVGDNVVYSEGHKDTEDLAILSRCDHLIISVGSFGWWAAWLANGTTVYYEGWPKPVSQLEYNVEKRDYFYSHWIPMA